MDPLVSILIPCYNAERWVGQAIESALAQTWPEKEVIVVDDGSTDGSLAVIQSFGDRIRYETGPNRGGNAARNRLLELARGEWLQYLDADDYLLPQKIARQTQFALQRSNCDIIYSAAAWERVEKGSLVRSETAIPEPHDPWILLAHWQLPQTGGPLWRKTALERVGGWRVGQPCCQEHELYFRLLEAGCRFDHCPGCFAIYRDVDHQYRVTRRLLGEVDHQRLLILDRIENCLTSCHQLTHARRQAINDTRLGIARARWLSDHGQALAVIQRIQTSDDGFLPGRGPASSPLYSFTYRLLGFRGAQLVAACARPLTSASR